MQLEGSMPLYSEGNNMGNEVHFDRLIAWRRSLASLRYWAQMIVLSSHTWFGLSRETSDKEWSRLRVLAKAQGDPDPFAYWTGVNLEIIVNASAFNTLNLRLLQGSSAAGISRRLTKLVQDGRQKHVWFPFQQLCDRHALSANLLWHQHP